MGSNGRLAGHGTGHFGKMPPTTFLHRGISRLRAEELLCLSAEDGSFLVRDSESVTNAYVLCVLYHGRVHQYRILPEADGRLSVQSEGDMQPLTFQDLSSLIQTYINKGDKNGLICPLRRSVPPETTESQEIDSEEDDFEEMSRDSDGDDKKLRKTFKHGILHNFSRLNLSACDGEFVDALKSYIDNGLEQDAKFLKDGSNKMPELQTLLQIAGQGLLREVDMFLLKLGMVQDILIQEEDERRRQSGATVEMTGKSYVSFLAAKLQLCKSQLLDVHAKAEEVLDEAKGDPYDYPEEAEALALFKQGTTPPTVSLRRHSVKIPLSTFEVKLLKPGKMSSPSKLSLNIDIRQGRLFAVKPSKDFLDASNTFTHDKILQLVKNTHDNSRLDVIMEGKKKYTYQFESAHERESFCLQIRQMKILHSQETDIDNLSIFIGTWNMGKSTPSSSLKFWLRCWGEGKSKDRTLSRIPHDLYVIGTQESGMTDKEWINMLKATLKSTLMVDVDLLDIHTLWGLRLVILVLPKHRNKISHLQKNTVRTGIANALGNKGAVAIAFMFNGTSLCFVNAHLASGEERLERRHANYRDILKGLTMGPKNLECYDITHKFHHVFFFGDLNYRVAEGIQSVLDRTEQRDLKYLLEKDQLRKAQNDKKAFFAFSESEIAFMPTYRLERDVAGYKYDWRKVKKTGERINVPSWCDRVLWHSFPGTFIENSAYGSVDNLLNSDHRPVFASFVLGVTSQFVQNRASLQGDSSINIIFSIIEAQIKTSFKQFYILEFSSTCLPDIIYCEPNKEFGTAQKAGMWSNPLWGMEQLPKLRPLFGDQDYLEDQHLLVAVKGAEDDSESFGECVLSLKGMFDVMEPQHFECTLTHVGEETGKLRGTWYIRCTNRSQLARSLKSYQIIALDTEYHDPEEIQSLTQWPNSGQDLRPVKSDSLLSDTTPDHAFTRKSTVMIHTDDEANTKSTVVLSYPKTSDAGTHPHFDRVNRLEAEDGMTSDSSPPPIPTKRSRPIFMGQSVLQSTPKPVTPLTVPVRPSPAPSAPPLPTTHPMQSSESSPISAALVLQIPQQTPWKEAPPPPIPRKLKPHSPPIHTEAAPKLYEELTRPKTVPEWLTGLGLTEYISSFLKTGIDSMGAVMTLTAAQVMRMGIRHPEHRTRILQSVNELSQYTEYKSQC